MKLPISKQITFVLIVAGVAFAVSFLLAFTVAALDPDGVHLTPSPLIGLSLGVVAGAMYLALARNRRVPIADAATRDVALRSVADGSARLIVFRQGFVGKLAGVDIHVDDVVATQLKSPRFAVLVLAPGRHVIRSQLQSKRSDPLTIDLAENETAAVEIVVGLGKSRPERRDDVASVRDRLARVPMVVV